MSNFIPSFRQDLCAENGIPSGVPVSSYPEVSREAYLISDVKLPKVIRPASSSSGFSVSRDFSARDLIYLHNTESVWRLSALHTDPEINLRCNKELIHLLIDVGRSELWARAAGQHIFRNYSSPVELLNPKFKIPEIVLVRVVNKFFKELGKTKVVGQQTETPDKSTLDESGKQLLLLTALVLRRFMPRVGLERDMDHSKAMKDLRDLHPLLYFKPVQPSTRSSVLPKLRKEIDSLSLNRQVLYFRKAALALVKLFLWSEEKLPEPKAVT